MDGPMWGLSYEENEKLYMRTLLCVLRIPGLFLMDIWWTDHVNSSIPVSLDLQDVADSGIHLILFVLVNITEVENHLTDNVPLQAMFILLLPLQELVRLYMNFISGAALCLSVFSIYHFVGDEIRIRNELSPGESLFGFDFFKRHVSRQFSSQYL